MNNEEKAYIDRLVEGMKKFNTRLLTIEKKIDAPTEKPIEFFSMSESIGELSTALSKAQGKMKAAVKNVTVNFSGNKNRTFSFADYLSLIETARPYLSEVNLSIVQLPLSDSQGRRYLRTQLNHGSGEYIQSTVEILPLGPSHQDWGTALTYNKRYSLSSMLGIATEDEDRLEQHNK